MVLVEGGTFQMGDTWGDGQLDEKLVHEVTLTYNFYLGRYEITNEEYVEFLNDKGINEDGSYNGKELIDMDDPDCQIKHNVYEFYIPDNLKNNPVIEVSWWGGIYYCNWLSEKEGLPKAYDEEGNLLDKNGNVTTDITKVKGYRLPTEAEWEFAARGGNESKGYKYAGSDDPDEVAWYLSNSEWHTHNVGTKKPNELGIYDMSGNVQERCQDVYAYYEISPETNPYNYYKTSSHRVVRGGSWPDSASDVRVANRYYGKPDYSYYNSGFRICRTAY
jgi:formylglycine-generating enzyme required for sulfatase activity